MAISIIEQNGTVAYGLKEYNVDTEDNLDDLTVEATPGSQAFVIETGDKYILNNSHEWKIMKGELYGY